MKMETLEDAFIHALSDIYSGEKQLTKALPKLAKSAASEELAGGFAQHLQETEQQIERIDRVVEECGIKLHRIKCKAMEGLIAESNEVLAEMQEGYVRDALLIAGAQKVEHYEIATYGTLVELAKKLGYREAARLLEETLEEERATDEKLSAIAINEVNPMAMRKAA